MWQRLFGIGDLEPRKFVDLVVRMGTKAGTWTSPDVDYDALRIKDGSRMMNLHNIYAQFLRIPRRQRRQFLETAVVAGVPALPERWEDAAAQLMPQLRDGAYLTLTPLHTARAGAFDGKDMPAVAYADVGAGLYATLAIDTPHSMAIVQEHMLASWGQAFDAALDVARSNLRRCSQEPFTRVGPGVWMAPWKDSYAAARVLLPEVLQRVCTNPLVVAPTRDLLFVAEPTHDGFLALVVMLTAAAEDESYPISRRIFQLVDKTLTPYTPEQPNAAYDRLLVEQSMGTYNEEKSVREALDEDGEVFFASLMAHEHEDGRIITSAVWPQPVVTCLPRADVIHCLVVGDDATWVRAVWEVPWAAVEAAPGLVTRTDAPLERWRTNEFPALTWLEAHGTRVEESQPGAN